MTGKKGAALLLCGAMVFSMFSMPILAAGALTAEKNTAVEFSDTANHWAKKSIERWTQYGIIKGEGAGTFNPDGKLTRGALATIISNLLCLKDKAPNTYADVKPGEWYADGVLKCTYAGIMKGDGASARPKATISRQESMVMIARALAIKPANTVKLDDFADAGDVAPWAAGYMTKMTQNGILSGVGGGKIAPKADITRASVMTIFDKAISDYVNGSGVYDKLAGTGITVVTAENAKLGGKITGDVLIAPGVGTGAITISKATVEGSITICGRGTKLLIDESNILGDITIAKDWGEAQILAQDSANIAAIIVESGNDGVIVKGKAENIQIGAKSNVTLQGSDVKTVAISGENASLVLDENSKAANVAVSGANAKITNNGKINRLAIEKTAAGAKYIGGERSVMPEISSDKMSNLTITTAEEEKRQADAEKGDTHKPQSNAQKLQDLLSFTKYMIPENYTNQSWEELMKAKTMGEAGQTAIDAKLKAVSGAVEKLALTGTAKTGVDALSDTMNRYFEQQNNSSIHAITLKINTETRVIQVCVFQPQVSLTVAMQGSGMKSSFTDPPVLNITAQDGTHVPVINESNERDPLGAAIFIADAIGAQYGVDPYLGTLADIIALPENQRDMRIMLGCGSLETHVAPTEYNAVYTLQFYQSPLRLQEIECNMTPKETKQLRVIATPPGAFIWESSDTSVATVDKTGMVTAVGSGTATISVGAEGHDGFPAQTTVIVGK